MEIQIKSVAVYIREDQFEQFIKGQELASLAWTLTPGDPCASRFNPIPQVQAQVSLDTYYALLDAKPKQDKQHDIDDYGFAGYI